VATFKISAVHVEEPPGYSHPHISEVDIGNGTWIQRSTVIKDLGEANGDRYYTEAGGERADVIAVDCPHCGAGDYITTEPDSTTENNLLSLVV